MRTLIFWIFIFGSFASWCSANPDLEVHRPFIKAHCIECHGPEKQKGDLRFDQLGTDLSDLQTLETWQGILDQLNLGEMPPKKQISDDEGSDADLMLLGDTESDDNSGSSKGDEDGGGSDDSSGEDKEKKEVKKEECCGQWTSSTKRIDYES